MGESEQPLIDLGRRVAALQDAAPEAQLDHVRGRTRLLLATGRERRAAPGRPFALAAVLAALALGVVAAVIVVRPREALRFEIGAPEPGVVGAWIAAPPSSPRAIRFSDGSQIDLAPDGRARVTAVDADGAEVALERGSLEVSVVHRAHTRWTVRVGPFQVHVVGTRFLTRWDPVSEQFEVALHEGAVTVSGPIVGEARPVHAGEVITVSQPKGTIEVHGAPGGPPAADPVRSPDATPAPAPRPGEPPAPSAEHFHGTAAGGSPTQAPVEPPPVPPSPPASARSADPSPTPTASAEAAPAPAAPAETSWRALARAARYKEALAAAEAEGFDGLCASSGAADLRALGDAARLGGSPARAAQALSALRSRFPGSPEAASAAFILGRMAQDQGRDYARAAGLYERYLAEQPGGELAAEAAGRLVEARDRMGDAAGARRAAERYLAAYPSGSHAAYARSVLARDQGSPR
jgi:TolA-binding protein